MFNVDSQKHFRQQITFAKVHANSMDDSDGPLLKHVKVQASLLSLQLGLDVYLSTLFESSVSDVGLDNLRAICESAKQSTPKQAELCTLICDPESWLTTLYYHLASLKTSAQATGHIQPHSSAVIASNRKKVWYELHKQDVDEFVEMAQELLDRHSHHDIEY